MGDNRKYNREGKTGILWDGWDGIIRSWARAFFKPWHMDYPDLSHLFLPLRGGPFLRSVMVTYCCMIATSSKNFFVALSMVKNTFFVGCWVCREKELDGCCWRMKLIRNSVFPWQEEGLGKKSDALANQLCSVGRTITMITYVHCRLTLAC